MKAVDRDAGAERLSGQARGRAAHAQRHAVAGGDLGRRRQVVDRARHQHRVGQHPVDRGVGRVQPARQRARTHLAGHVPGKLGGRGQAAFAGGSYACFGAHRPSIDVGEKAAPVCASGSGKERSTGAPGPGGAIRAAARVVARLPKAKAGVRAEGRPARCQRSHRAWRTVTETAPTCSPLPRPERPPETAPTCSPCPGRSALPREPRPVALAPAGAPVESARLRTTRAPAGAPSRERAPLPPRPADSPPVQWLYTPALVRRPPRDRSGPSRRQTPESSF